VRRGVPRAAATGVGARDLWPWLALAGGLFLLTEWLLFGRRASARAAMPLAGKLRRLPWPRGARAVRKGS